MIWDVGAKALELLLGTDSGVVREIITEELAKGLDAYWRLSADDALDAARARLVSVLGVCAASTTFLPGTTVLFLKAPYGDSTG